MSSSSEDRTETLERRIEELEKQQQQSSSGMSPWFHLYVIGTSIAASLSLFSLFRDFIKIHQSFLDIINAWAALVRPVAEFLFSWVFEIFGFAMPVWMGDYLFIGLVILSGRIRAITFRLVKFGSHDLNRWMLWSMTFAAFLAWPFYILFELSRFRGAMKSQHKYPVPWVNWFYLLFSPFIYFIILLLANYTALFIWTGAAT